jgi:hypothetical protein
MEEDRAQRKAPACPAFALRQRELPAAARKFERPLSRFPRRGKAGAGTGAGFPGRAGSPHAAGTLCASKKRWHTSMPRLPPQGGFQSAPLNPPLAHPPDGRHRGFVVMVGREELRMAATSALTFTTFS